MSWFLTLLLILFLFYTLWRHPFFELEHIPRKWIIVTFVLKLVAMTALIWIYTHHYTNRQEADIYKYFDDGMILSRVAEQSPADYLKLLTGIGHTNELEQKYLSETHFWNHSKSVAFLNNNKLMIRFNSILALLSTGNIYFHSIAASFLGFCGCLMFYLVLEPFVTGKEKLFFAGLFMAPSLIFWTSGMLKEALMIFGMGGLLYQLHIMTNCGFRYNNIVLSLFFAGVLLMSKSYILFFLIPAAMAWAWNSRYNDKKGFWRYLVVNALLVGLITNLSEIFPGLTPHKSLIIQQQEFKCLAEWIGAGSMIYIPDLTNNPLSFVQAMPYALYNALLRPTVFDGFSAIMLPAIIEITTVTLLFILALSYRSRLTHQQRNMLYFCLNFTILLALLIGLTTPVLGALVRYRVAMLPFMIFSVILLIDKKCIPFKIFSK